MHIYIFMHIYICAHHYIPFFFRHAPVADIHSKTKEVLGHQGVGRNMVLYSTLACSCKDVFILEVVSMIISMRY